MVLPPTAGSCADAVSTGPCSHPRRRRSLRPSIAHECPSVAGTYTNGFWVGESGSSYLMDAELYEHGDPEPDDAPDEHD
ncbi:hypothetical protein A6035_16525 [Dietzia lutea]|uniref:Uncharacterized protein n=1 Tax=Dietzia lutea TaxID=546160 RepID=A0A2S1RB53_9ACTN|nr:hypothetical protein A6035_16525 [Dietzia lutea]